MSFISRPRPYCNTIILKIISCVDGTILKLRLKADNGLLYDITNLEHQCKTFEIKYKFI